MAVPVFSAFSSWRFTSDTEELGAQILQGANIQWIQSLIAKSAQEKLNLDYDPLNPLRFAQQEARIKGEIQILQYLLSCSENAVATLATTSQN